MEQHPPTERAEAEESASQDRLLLTDEVADLLRHAPRTLEGWRREGTGPRWLRIGRRVLYPESGVREYLARVPGTPA